MLFNKYTDPKASDEELIQRFCNENDLEMLGALYNRYLHLVYGVCLKYLKNREDSQDAVMQIFEVLTKEVSKHEIRMFKSWLHRVTRNYCLMQLRSYSSKKNKQSVSFDESFMENETEMHHLDRVGGEENKSEALTKCLETLKKEQQQTVKMFYYAEQCYREIADELNIEEKKVKSFIQNGKRNLKLCLEGNKKVSNE